MKSMSGDVAEYPAVQVVGGEELNRLRMRLEDRGICRKPGVDPDLWHPAHAGESPKALFWEQIEARTACAGCPVARECVRAVVSMEIAQGRRKVLSGIWGGFAEWEWRLLVDRVRKSSGSKFKPGTYVQGVAA
ncbi:MAG: WhiB family transcriptional regulator [Angustibacter sp.]